MAKNKKEKTFKQNGRAAKVAALAERVSAELSNGEKPNQQTWAEMAYYLVRQEIIPSAPADTIVTYGFPKGKRGSKHLGQCWYRVTPDDKSVIFIAPCEWTTPLEVLDTLTHEICHAATPGAGHRGEFKRLALSIGMKGQMRAASAGPELMLRLNELAKRLPPFPAAAFDPPTKKQETRLRLWECRCPTKFRVASDTVDATCHKCNARLVLVSKKTAAPETPAHDELEIASAAKTRRD
jgi:hypothetical protein